MSLSQGFPNTFIGQVTNQVTKNHESELRKIYTDVNNLMATDGHAHTGSGSDGKAISNDNITATVNQAIATATANTGTNTQMLSWLVKELLIMKGNPTNWYDTSIQTWSEKFLLINPTNGSVSPIMPLTRDGIGQYFKFYPQGAVASATSIYFFTGSGSITHGSLTNIATSMTVSTAITFTGTPYVLIDSNGLSEVVKLTAGSGTTTLTIVRAQLGTTALAHSSGGIVLDSNPGNVSISSIAPVSWTASGLTTASKRDLFAYSVSGTGLTSCTITCVQEWGNR